ncbi:SusD/RagB family nutrient-binding outer membrane lipoprotein [Algoriphagus sediminis]|uniref:SusD/RagB family nutrient-binding outer membrane lipoprotein n=1 Tax=Algoriphagus sediminis TaxID=3057113 RepID=A0ABT7Y9P6_9BACT|nr:SusD/RagB family nutrient-binding outer membrane lipoprotein [Algoriphagus sediminis]MDN3203238.1 SusD/RagB family nutrient-binding outer membrane lipoprotein [Algoriphagus sediminis]
MKFKNKLYTILGAGILLTTSACDSFLDVNENPNSPEDAPISGLLTNSTYETSLNVQRIGSTTSNYVQYLASPNPGSSSDTMDPVNFSGTWFSLYNVMTDLNEIIRKAEESGANHYLGAGQILMALNLGMTVDIFGDVPFSESFNFETVTPSYDNDEELYVQVISLLDQGIANLQEETSISIGADDFIYGGSIDNWIKLGHSLKARFLLHTKGTSTYNENEVLAAVASGFQSNEDDATVTFFEQRFNPWAQVAINNANLLLGGWISEQFVQALDGTSYPTVDPRLPLMIGTTDEGEFVGTVNGAGRGDAPEQGARSTLIPGQYYTSTTSPLLIATFAELKFIEAEVALSSDPGRAYAAYLAGIEAHMDMLNVSEEDKQAYLADPSVSVGAGALTLDDIMKEKWVAMFLHPETWNDARRFDYAYKDMTTPENLNPDLNGNYIRRLAYPDSEVSRNGANVPEVTLLDRIWWNQ